MAAASIAVAGCGTDTPPPDEASRVATGTATNTATNTGAPPAQPSHDPQALSALDPAARRYVDAVAAADLDALVDSFATDAVIVDVSREIRGQDAIREWAGNEVIGGRLTVLGVTPKPGGTTMLVRFEPGGSGGFEANYEFDIADGVITRASLQYA